MFDRYCRRCSRPIMQAFLADGTDIVVDRQHDYVEGEVLLTEVRGEMYANLVPVGQGQHRVHRCKVDPPKLSASEHAREIEKILLLADKLAATRLTRGSRGAMIVLLAEEVRFLKEGPAVEREVIDGLLTAYKQHADELPPVISQLLGRLQACRQRYYM